MNRETLTTGVAGTLVNLVASSLQDVMVVDTIWEVVDAVPGDLVESGMPGALAEAF